MKDTVVSVFDAFSSDAKGNRVRDMHYSAIIHFVLRDRVDYFRKYDESCRGLCSSPALLMQHKREIVIFDLIAKHL